MRLILSRLYGLEDLNAVPEDIPGTRGHSFLAFVFRGGFHDNSILQQHLRANDHKVLEGCDICGCQVVTLLRDPYDAFVSFYFYVNRMKRLFRELPDGVMIGKPIDHPEVVAFIRSHYKRHLKMAHGWLRSQRAVVVRYEDMRGDTEAAIRDLTSEIGARPEAAVRAAVEACRAERLRGKGEATKDHRWIRSHIRSATTGDSSKYLTQVHFDAFRESSAGLIRALGYPVR